MSYDPAYWERREKQRMKERKNFILESSPKLLSIAKRTENKKIRSGALKLYFENQRELREILSKLSN